MTQTPLLSKETKKPESTILTEFEVGLPGDTLRFCIETDKLISKSQLICAMLSGSPDPARKIPPPTVKLPYIEKHAFDYFLKYLRDEPVNFESVVSARNTLDVAYQFLCPQLALTAVNFLEKNLNSSNVLRIYHGLLSYSSDLTFNSWRQQTDFPAPVKLKIDDSIAETVAVCNSLLNSCLVIIDAEIETILSEEYFEELCAEEVSRISFRDSLILKKESTLFAALDRWSDSECKRQNKEPTSVNRRAVLADDVWFSVRYLLMSDDEFIQGPMSSGILTNEESAHIISRILRRDKTQEKMIECVEGAVQKLSNIPRMNRNMQNDFHTSSISSEEREQRENRRNRRKECVIQGQRACARLGNCLVRILACVFD